MQDKKVMEFETFSPEETLELGRKLAREARPGDVYTLVGDLGVGKTVFTQGIAQGLGIVGHITSPTFTLLNIYQTPAGTPLHHFDWYRVEDPEELLAAGLDEFISGEFITLIEWHERAPELLPDDCLEVVITVTSETQRNITILSKGSFRKI